MTDFKVPRTEIEWSRRAIINVVGVLAAHAESLTLVGAHAVLFRTMDLDAPRMPTGDGDLGVTPGLVSDVPSIEALLAKPATSIAPRLVQVFGAESRTTNLTSCNRSGKRSTCWQRMDSLARSAEASAVSRRCELRTANSPLATRWVWSSRRSIGRA